MLVYVLSKNGQPLMPTHRYGFVRRLLNSQKAKVRRRCPFTIQLQYDTSCKTQPATLGIRLFDKVKYNHKEYFIFGRRASGFFDIRTLNGEKVNKGSISCKKLKLLEASKGYLTERRNASLSPLNSV